MEIREHAYTISGNTKQHSQYGEQQGDPENTKKTDQPQNSKVPLPGIPLSSEIIIPKHTCTTTSLPLCLQQQQEHRSLLNIHQQVNEEINMVSI